jgi:hypothetical protein
LVRNCKIFINYEEYIGVIYFRSGQHTGREKVIIPIGDKGRMKVQETLRRNRRLGSNTVVE